MKRVGQPSVLHFGAKRAPAWQRLVSFEPHMRPQLPVQAASCLACCCS